MGRTDGLGDINFRLMIISTQSLLNGMTEMMNISRNGCVLSNIDCQPNKSIFKLLFQMYLVIPNRGAIYLFHTNTPKKKPILEAIDYTSF